MKTLKQCLQHLKRAGFISLTNTNDQVNNLRSLAIKVERNLERNLDSFYELSNKLNVFPVNSIDEIGDFGNYFRPKNSVSLSQFGVHFHTTNSLFSSNDNHWNICRDLTSRKTLLYICDKEKSLQWFHWFQSNRRIFWRKFSGFPSRFTVTDIFGEEKSQNQFLNIIFNPNIEDKTILLERIGYFVDNNELIHRSLRNSHIICCECFLPNGVISYLVDGCIKNESHDDFRSLWIHEHLAPFQVAFAVESTPSNMHRFQEVVNYLSVELKNCGVSLFPYSMSSDESFESKFRKFDEIGVLYTIILKESSLKNGVLFLRNRDTQLNEEIHISNLKMSVLLYLRLKRPTDFADEANVDETIVIKKERKRQQGSKIIRKNKKNLSCINEPDELC